MKKIKYRDGYKYQLVEDYEISIAIFNHTIETKYICLSSNGILTIRAGYAWDGCSGPTIDTKNTMRGGLVHDALFQLMRMGLLEERYIDTANKIFYAILRQDGMSWLRAKIFFVGVNTSIAESHAKHGTEPKVLEVP